MTARAPTQMKGAVRQKRIPVRPDSTDNAASFSTTSWPLILFITVDIANLVYQSFWRSCPDPRKLLGPFRTHPLRSALLDWPDAAKISSLRAGLSRCDVMNKKLELQTTVPNKYDEFIKAIHQLSGRNVHFASTIGSGSHGKSNNHGNNHNGAAMPSALSSLFAFQVARLGLPQLALYFMFVVTSLYMPARPRKTEHSKSIPPTSSSILGRPLRRPNKLLRRGLWPQRTMTY
ncbi:hypothetical protein V8F20_004211 [Naviculisporaceae sp. PSN 640]